VSHFDPEAAKTLIALLNELAAKHGLSLSEYKESARQRDVYESYLRELGRDPDEVDPLIDMNLIPRERRAEIHGQILRALMNAESLNSGELKGLLELTVTMFGEHRASRLVQRFSENLASYCRGQDIYVPDFASGVFPMSWFNAQCAMHRGTPIVLLANGCMRLLEVAVALFFVSIKDMTYARRELRSAVMRYVDSGGIVEPAKYGLGRGLVEFSPGLMHALISAAEEFVISHEIGHIVLGHLKSESIHAAPIVRRERLNWKALFSRAGEAPATISVAEKSHFEEYQADAWGYRLMLQRAKANQENEAAVPIAAASAGLFLGVNMLIEAASRERHISIGDTHPAGMSRLYIAQLLTELEGCHEQAYIARRFYEFLEKVAEDFPGLEMPPLLSRELNQIAIPVMNSLNINLDGADFIQDFV
jgi:hypothetical protein